MRRRCASCASSTIPAGCCAPPRCISPPPRSGSTPSATISRTGSCSPRSRRAPARSPRSPSSRTRRRRSRSRTRRVVITLEHGDRVTAALAIGADGRRSLCRQAAGIATDRQAYRQTALTFNLRHQRPHQDSSTEFHTGTGPFTLVPLPGLRSSLVLVVDPDEAARIGALAPDAARRRDRTAIPFDPRPHRAGARPRRLSAGDRDRPALRGGARGAGRRSRPSAAADRRAGSQSRLARRRHDRRAGGGDAPGRRRCGRSRSRRAL